MEKQNIKRLKGWEKEVYLWLEQNSSIMVKATTEFTDPVELSSTDARNLAKLLNEAADELEQQ